MGKRKFIFDCDTGTDDAIAIMAALYEPEAEILAFTTVDGNVEVEYTSRNTLDLVNYLGFDIPVAVGAAEGLKQRYNYHETDSGITHGRTGLGCLTLPETERPFSEKRAAELIYEKARECGGELEICAVGPLTNIALAILEYPEVKTLVKHLWIMGGAVWGGNMNTTAEFNIWADPEGARVVFRSGIPITMVGLDATLKAVLDETDRDFMRALHTKAGDFCADMLQFMIDREAIGGEAPIMHDALAWAAAMCPECVKTQRVYVDVECDGEYTFGHTFADLRNRLGRPANCDVAMDVDLPKFREYLRGCYARSK